MIVAMHIERIERTVNFPTQMLMLLPRVFIESARSGDQLLKKKKKIYLRYADLLCATLVKHKIPGVENVQLLENRLIL
jgi:hypothetical protein